MGLAGGVAARIPLPEGLGRDGFTVEGALGAGLSPSRLRGRDLARPFWGVRMPAADDPDVTVLARAYTARMHPQGFFSHVTAAQLHSIPLPLHLTQPLPLDVSVPDGARAARGQGIRGHRLAVEPFDVITRRGLRMTSLERTLCDLSSLLSDEDLIAAGDNILWRKRLRGNRATPRSLSAAVARFTGRRGRARLCAMAPLLTDRADSAPESTMRLRFIRAGLPQTLVNVEILSATGAPLATPDLQFERYRMALDYEGLHHLTDPKQWRKDLARVPRLQDAGWHHTRMSADDLADSTELIARLRRLLIERGWRP